MSQPPSESHIPLIFLDTNAMHAARLYLGFAQQHRLPPVEDSTQNPDEKLREKYGRRNRTVDSFVKGRQIIFYLRDQCSSGTMVEYSPITLLEMACGLLRGRAILSAAEEGVTSRMWNRLEEREILYRLNLDDYEIVKGNTAGLQEQFQDIGINMNETKSERMREIWSLARLLLGLIFLDVGDCVIYASALLSEAENLVTTDNYFRDVINYVQNPGGAPPENQSYYYEIQPKIVKLVSDAIGIDASKVHLPVVPSIG